ncbi:MAG: hypothetical protein R3C18_00115 [Planctomycetaceae bacterium]
MIRLRCQRQMRRRERPFCWNDLRDALWCSAGLHGVGLFALTLLMLARPVAEAFGPLDTTIGWADATHDESTTLIDTTILETQDEPSDPIDDIVPVSSESVADLPVPREPPSADSGMWSELTDRRSLAGGGAGELTVTLMWQTGCDLDLHLFGPGGSHGYFRQRETIIGRLDVDCNARQVVPRPVENFCSGQVLDGEYRIQVQRYLQRNGGQPVQFTVGVQVLGEQRLFTGELDGEREITVATFRVRGRQVFWSGSR